jgi:hypothetical protein
MASNAIERCYYTLPAMVLKVVLRLVPTRVKAAIAATAIKAAIKAYSIAVTPDSSRTRSVRNLRNRILLVSETHRAQIARESLIAGKRAKRGSAIACSIDMNHD